MSQGFGECSSVKQESLQLLASRKWQTCPAQWASCLPCTEPWPLACMSFLAFDISLAAMQASNILQEAAQVQCLQQALACNRRLLIKVFAH